MLGFGLTRRNMQPLRLLAAKAGAIGISTLSTRIEQRATPPSQERQYRQ